MPEDDPYDLERYWDRLRGPRPKVADSPKVPHPAAVDLLDEAVARGLWAAALISIRGAEPAYGRRFLVTNKSVVEGGIEVNLQLPPAEQECVIHGVALWESATAIQPLAIAPFAPTTLLVGDSGELSVKVSR